MLLFNASREFRKMKDKEAKNCSRTRKWIGKQFIRALKKFFKNAKTDNIYKLSLITYTDSYNKSMLKVTSYYDPMLIIYECSADFEGTIRSILLKWYSEPSNNEFSIKR